MIPVNDAISTCMAAIVLAVAIVVWACRAHWRARADDAYQEGHAAGIETQLARTARANARAQRPPASGLSARQLDAIYGPGNRADTEVLAIAVTGPPPGRPRRALPPALDFPEALPDGLREWVQHTWRPESGGGREAVR